MMEMPSFISKQVSLKSLNTFQIDESSVYFSRACREEDLLASLNFAEEAGLRLLVLGGGSNILLTGSFVGLVLKIENQGIALLKEEEEKVLIRVSAVKTGIPLFSIAWKRPGLGWKIFPSFPVRSEPLLCKTSAPTEWKSGQGFIPSGIIIWKRKHLKASRVRIASSDTGKASLKIH
jgi:hypothetical protein